MNEPPSFDYAVYGRPGSQSDRPMWNISTHGEERSFSRNFNPEIKDVANVKRILKLFKNFDHKVFF